VSSKPLEEVKALGGKAAATPSEAATAVDAVVTMLPSSPHVRDVYEKVLPIASPGTLLVDCSTIDPATTRALSATAAGKKLRMIDAPVSGGVGGAEAGTLTFMVGGSAADFEAARSLLQCMGKVVVHCGASGTGQIAKLVNNLIRGWRWHAAPSRRPSCDARGRTYLVPHRRRLPTVCALQLASA